MWRRHPAQTHRGIRDPESAAEGARDLGTFERISRDSDGFAVIHYRNGEQHRSVRARAVIGADGAASGVARPCVPAAEQMPYVYAYHEIVRSPQNGAAAFDGSRCDVYYQSALSPDFYGWIFPHGDTTSVGVQKEVFAQTVATVQARNADVPDEQFEAAIDDALRQVRAHMWGKPKNTGQSVDGPASRADPKLA